MLPIYEHARQDPNLRVLVYNGDTDPGINSFVSQNWTVALGLDESEGGWRQLRPAGERRGTACGSNGFKVIKSVVLTRTPTYVGENTRQTKNYHTKVGSGVKSPVPGLWPASDFSLTFFHTKTIDLYEGV